MTKKVLFYVAAALIIIGAGIGIYLEVTNKDKETPVEIVNLKNEIVSTVDVEQTLILDKEYMALQFGEYKHFETCVLTKYFMDEDTVHEVAGVANIFQVQQKSDSGTLVNVYSLTHTLEGFEINVEENAFWIEDLDLCEDTVKYITFKEAYNTLLNSDYVLPHSQHCVLRKAVGPKLGNAQYIFGNVEKHYYVDAVTADTAYINPWGLPEK